MFNYLKSNIQLVDISEDNIYMLILVVLIIQIICTTMTNTKKFSIQAFLRNLLWGYSLYQIYYTKNILWLFVPIIMNMLYNGLIDYKLKLKIQPYITTEYLYNDFFEYVVENDKNLNYYTEGSYGDLLNINTLDLSKKNINKIMNWGEEQYNNAFLDKTIVDLNNKKIDISNIANKGQEYKFKWIVDNLNINKNSKVLELGFGKLDLMKYIRINTGAEVVGCNLCKEHVDDARKNGFEAHQINHKHLDKHINKLGKFDIIITNGTLEYLENRNSSNIYDEFMKNVNKLLNKGGKWYTTTIHYNKYYCILDKYLDVNYYNLYNLAQGNEGGYPKYPDGLTGYSKNNNLKVIKQENRWLDYYIYSIIWYCCYIKFYKNYKNKFSLFIKDLNVYIASPNYLESYLCYIPFKNMYYYQPWLWQFIYKDGCVPTYHQWIIFEKIENL